MRGLAVVVTVALGVAALDACGSGDLSGAGTVARRPTGVTALPQTGDRTRVEGVTVFRQQCSACHSLIGNESLHKQGGDLVGYSLTRQQLQLQTREMPVKHPLSDAQLAAVVQYVWSVQHPAHSG